MEFVALLEKADGHYVKRETKLSTVDIYFSKAM